MQVTTIEELQEKIGLLEENNPLGIVYQSIEYTALYDMLKNYLVTVDFQLYYKYGNRVLSRKYDHAFVMENYKYIKDAVYYALLSEEYRLKTLIDTTTLEYNPLDNYDITETIVTTTTISDKIIKGAQENEKSISQIKTSNDKSDTINTGAITETGNNTTEYGEQKNVNGQVLDYGQQSENGTNIETKSPYNDDMYHPRLQNTTQNTKTGYQDTVDIDETIGTHTDKVSTSKTTNARTDTTHTTNTRTQSPYTETDRIGERNDSNDRKSNEDKQRNVHGRHGYTTTQSLIQAERDISNISIVEEIIKIVLNTISTRLLWIE